MDVQQTVGILKLDRQFIPVLLEVPCTTAPDDHTGVDRMRALRRVEKVSLIEWSLGGLEPPAGPHTIRKSAQARAIGPAFRPAASAGPPALTCWFSRLLSNTVNGSKEGTVRLGY